MSAAEGLPWWNVSKARAVMLVAGCGLIGVVAYVLQEDRQVQKRKQARIGEKQALGLLHQVKRDTEQVEREMDQDVDSTKREYKRAHCNEMFLRLLERLDTIQPRSAVLQHQDRAPSPYEQHLIESIKEKKRKLIHRIEKGFSRLDSMESQPHQ